MTARGGSILRTALYTLVVVMLLLIVGIEYVAAGIDLLVQVCAGWAMFLLRVVPRLQVRWGLVASAFAYALLLIGGANSFLRWLHREMRKTPANSSPTVAPRWHWRWTITGFLLVILMFTSGIAAVGVVHQTTWLITSPTPVFEVTRGRERASRVKCRSNLRTLGAALRLYAEHHDHRYPESWATMLLDDPVLAEAMSPYGFHAFVCPSSVATPATAPSVRECTEQLASPQHCSYIYLGQGALADSVIPRRVLALEPLTNHGGHGVNVLYADGSTEWLDAPAADALLRELKLESAAAK